MDTGYYIAFYNKNDKFHSKAMNIFQDLKSNKYGHIYTSLDVLDELFTFLQRKDLQNLANKIIDDWFIKNKNFGKILYSSPEVLNQAINVFVTQKDERKGLSFTDCLIIGNCKFSGITNLVTFEKGFHNFLNVIQ